MGGPPWGPCGSFSGLPQDHFAPTKTACDRIAIAVCGRLAAEAPELDLAAAWPPVGASAVRPGAHADFGPGAGTAPLPLFAPDACRRGGPELCFSGRSAAAAGPKIACALTQLGNGAGPKLLQPPSCAGCCTSARTSCSPPNGFPALSRAAVGHHRGKLANSGMGCPAWRRVNGCCAFLSSSREAPLPAARVSRLPARTVAALGGAPISSLSRVWRLPICRAEWLWARREALEGVRVRPCGRPPGVCVSSGCKASREAVLAAFCRRWRGRLNLVDQAWGLSFHRPLR